MADDFPVFRLHGEQPLAQAVDEVDACLRQARDDGHARVLLDLRGLTGFAAPGLLSRLGMMRRWADTAGGRLKVALVCHSGLIDGERFGVVVAQSLGFDGNVFEDEAEACHWLQENPALWSGRPPAL